MRLVKNKNHTRSFGSLGAMNGACISKAQLANAARFVFDKSSVPEFYSEFLVFRINRVNMSGIPIKHTKIIEVVVIYPLANFIAFVERLIVSLDLVDLQMVVTLLRFIIRLILLEMVNRVRQCVLMIQTSVQVIMMLLQSLIVEVTWPLMVPDKSIVQTKCMFVMT